MGDFPGGPVVRNLPPNAEDAGSIPGRGTKIPRASGQLSSEAQLESPRAANYRAHVLWSPGVTTREKPACHNEEPACCNEDPECCN